MLDRLTLNSDSNFTLLKIINIAIIVNSAHCADCLSLLELPIAVKGISFCKIKHTQIHRD